MRITAGLYKGLRLRCPNEDIRPVMSKMRESIFSMLISRFGSLEGLRFLDLFCGSAVMSVEAASRGVGYIEAVERDRRKKKILEQNLAIIGVPWKLHIVDVYDYLGRHTQSGRNCQNPETPRLLEPFDIIYLDPPFRMASKAKLLQSLGPDLWQAGSLVMLHLPKSEEGQLPRILDNGLALERSKYYGGSALCLYGPSPSADLPSASKEFP